MARLENQRGFIFLIFTSGWRKASPHPNPKLTSGSLNFDGVVSPLVPYGISELWEVDRNDQARTDQPHSPVRLGEGEDRIGHLGRCTQYNIMDTETLAYIIMTTL